MLPAISDSAGELKVAGCCTIPCTLRQMCPLEQLKQRNGISELWWAFRSLAALHLRLHKQSGLGRARRVDK
eukprot:1232979-Rhodomonas_salina.1